ncbi:MAG: NUDIX domain-containing protein [Bacteroidia bacterium]|nr:NUDIX domain-containing protein [Bacteroidia bacterium]
MMQKRGGKITLRVYGILLHDGNVLVSDEYIRKNKVTKFPGGGLHFGEGTIDALKREFMEEMKQPVEVISHYYTTDFFVSSAFHVRTQVISIYYLLKPLGPIVFQTSSVPHDYVWKEGAQSLRWLDYKSVNEDQFTLIIDRKVGEMLEHDFMHPDFVRKVFSR